MTPKPTGQGPPQSNLRLAPTLLPPAGKPRKPRPPGIHGILGDRRLRVPAGQGGKGPLVWIGRVPIYFLQPGAQIQIQTTPAIST